MHVIKHLNGIACALVVLIALIVGAREVPECTALADDASNDGIAVCLDERSTQAPSRVIAPEGSRLYTTRRFFLSGKPNLASLPIVFSVLGKAGPELLRLLALQRE